MIEFKFRRRTVIGLMKPLVFISALFLAGVVCAQNPTPELDTTELPVQQGDPQLKTFSTDTYLKNHKRIMPEELPKEVIRTLEAGSQYEGWRKAPIYVNEKGDRFVVEITTADRTERFQFDRQGKPVPLDQ